MYVSSWPNILQMTMNSHYSRCILLPQKCGITGHSFDWLFCRWSFCKRQLVLLFIVLTTCVSDEHVNNRKIAFHIERILRAWHIILYSSPCKCIQRRCMFNQPVADLPPRTEYRSSASGVRDELPMTINKRVQLLNMVSF
jgi:hypothetical protein